MKLNNTVMAPYDNIDRTTLIQKYLNAETSVEEEHLLAGSFAYNPPKDEEEKRVAAIIVFSANFFSNNILEETDTIQGAAPGIVNNGKQSEEFDRVVSQGKSNGKCKDNKSVKSKKRSRIQIWRLSLSGLAATVALFFLLHLPAEPQADNSTVLIEQIQQMISQIGLEDADQCEFRPIEGGYIMTAHFPNGETSSYILVAEEDGKTYSLLSLNQ